MWSTDVSRQESKWSEARLLLHSEVAHMLEVVHGVALSAEQMSVSKTKRTRQPCGFLCADLSCGRV
jgi:hypothetical protein